MGSIRIFLAFVRSDNSFAEKIHFVSDEENQLKRSNVSRFLMSETTATADAFLKKDGMTEWSHSEPAVSQSSSETIEFAEDTTAERKAPATVLPMSQKVFLKKCSMIEDLPTPGSPQKIRFRGKVAHRKSFPYDGCLMLVTIES
jgi:hypothetical protein